MRYLMILALALPLSGCGYVCRGYELMTLFGGPSSVEQAGDAIQPKRAQ